MCLQNYTRKIVHSSAMHYQNLIIIHECNKMLSKMKYSTHKIKTLFNIVEERFKKLLNF